MNSVLALSDRERVELFSATAQKLGFSNEAIAEKDFWVCWTLGQLFQGIPGIGDHLVFKGGTSLSKVYRAINRFSEDVDITVGRELLGFDSDEHDPEKAANKSQAKKK
jgi:predicted nucleotidyltransferase component of viral defense system